jgi:hypothetical protein
MAAENGVIAKTDLQSASNMIYHPLDKFKTLPLVTPRSHCGWWRATPLSAAELKHGAKWLFFFQQKRLPLNKYNSR